MNYCVLVKIAKHKVSFWYQSEGSPYMPLLIKESNEVPLYFYVNGNDFIFGNAARDRFYSNDPNAYGNYFEIIKDPAGHFTIYNNKKPYKQLFYFGIEQYLSHFINTVLYNSNSIESYRPNFPLRFLFETDIEDKEKVLIEHIFAEAGYNNVERVTYNQCLFEVLSAKGLLKPDKSVLLLNGIDNNLYLQLYKSPSGELDTASKLQGHGADPRVKILAEMILEYITSQNSHLSVDKEKEIAALLPFSAVLLSNASAVVSGEAELTDGKSYWFSVRERNLTERLLYYSNDSIIYTAIDELVKSANLTIENTILVLGSEQINTSYFLEKLLKKYSNVTGVETADGSDTMKLVFAKIAASGYRPANKTIEILIPVKTTPIVPPVQRPDIPISEMKVPDKPIIKTPPILPPKPNPVLTDTKPISKPGLPEIPNPASIKKPVLPPPLPPKK